MNVVSCLIKAITKVDTQSRKYRYNIQVNIVLSENFKFNVEIPQNDKFIMHTLKDIEDIVPRMTKSLDMLQEV